MVCGAKPSPSLSSQPAPFDMAPQYRELPQFWYLDPDDRPKETLPWHPKLTGARMLIISSTLTLGILKALYTDREHTGTTLGLVGQLGVVNICFLLDQQQPTTYPPFLFAHDYLQSLASILRLFGIPVSIYCSDDRPRKNEPCFPYTRTRAVWGLTGYRILVSVCGVGFGLAKAGLSYTNRVGEANQIEWIYGSIITICLYWLGLYEDSIPPRWPLFFHHDFSTPILRILNHLAQFSSILIPLSLALGVTWWFRTQITNGPRSLSVDDLAFIPFFNFSLFLVSTFLVFVYLVFRFLHLGVVAFRRLVSA
ncbi:hypothetical protein CC2G_011108 [Coprinopsis cinerea AmutBmut pab1-1]|nr:hypothetical protein CC2G_011108 [Coprinopsis cinerea AmutBmut pab1-1]